jgi:hypothetical protein
MPPSPPAAAATTAAAAWLGTWARPADRPAQLALALGGFLLLVALAPGGPRWLASALDFASLTDLTRRRRFLTVAAFVAAFLSLGYVAYYLHGGPRSPLAATYWLEGRAMSRGALSWAAPDPSANFRAHDLLFTAPDRVAGIFPPGYALLLAPAFLVGAPMLVGPLLAAGLVLATWLLARELATAWGAGAEEAERIARVAAGLSILSAALRYHTAEVLPQGASAVALTAALASALRARRTEDPRLFGVAGLAVGFLVAAHPLSAVAVGAVIAAMSLGARDRVRALSWTLGAALPGALLLLAANRAAVGHAFASPIAAYLAAFEPHEPVTAGKAVLATLRGLRLHLLDVANLEPLALLAIVPLLRGSPRAPRLAALVVAGQILLALPLDAASATPGMGARMLAPVVPVEHALVALALLRLAPRRLAPAALATFALSLAGFAVHASHDHRLLASADTGHPHYEPDVAREANVTHGLLFFDDDQGFELAFDPGVPASHGVQAVRLRGDDHDRILYDSLGHPAIHRYIPAAGASGTATVSFWNPPGAGSETYRFEAESDWPPAGITGGRAAVVEVPSSCASEARVLELTPGGAGEATLTIALPVPRGPTPSETKSWNVTPRVLQRGGAGSATLVVVTSLGGPPVAEWTWQDAGKSPTCTDLPAKSVELGGDVTRAWMVIRAQGGPVTLDKTTLKH